MVSGQQVLAILDGIVECFYALDRAWRITAFNRGAEEFFAQPRDEVLGRVVFDALRIRAVAGLEAVFQAAMDGQASPLMEFASPGRPGRWLEGRAFPLPDGIGVSFRDVTERRTSEAALRRREAELARVQRIAGVGGLEVDLRRGFDNRRSPEYLRLHGLPPEAERETHADWVNRIHPDDRERTERHFRESVIGGAHHYAAEYRIIRPSDGQERWIAASAEIERDESGRATRLVGAHRDITERKRAEARRELLINELNHRVKNTLATVQSIAAQTWRDPGSRQEAWTAFEARLMALSRAHDVLTRENWEGADVREIVGQAAAPYRGAPEERVLIDGPAVQLCPPSALALAMALQELMTNAVKYGALSRNGGRVRVTWRLAEPSGDAESGDGPRLWLTWQEEGGPPVSPPKSRGFGTRLVERSLAHDLGGEVAITFAPEGVRCTVDARLRTRPGLASAGQPTTAGPPPSR